MVTGGIENVDDFNKGYLVTSPGNSSMGKLSVDLHFAILSRGGAPDHIFEDD